MMAHLHHNLSTAVKGPGQELFWRCRGMMFCNIGLTLTHKRRRRFKNRGLVHCCTSTSSLADDEKLDSRINEDNKLQLTTPTSADQHVNSAYQKLGSRINEVDRVRFTSTSTNHRVKVGSRINEDDRLQFGYLVRDAKWQVRRMLETEEEMREVAHVQAEAFHEPAFFFDDVFFKFFEAEVLAGLMYRLRNSPPDRYACLVAEPTSELQESKKELAGVVDMSVLREDSVLEHLQGAKEYIYVSGIAVLNKFRRQKVATALLNACEALSAAWGFDYLALRAYEDDHGARKLYSNAGYRVVSQDPLWMSSWIGRRRRVLMVKETNI